MLSARALEARLRALSAASGAGGGRRSALDGRQGPTVLAWVEEAWSRFTPARRAAAYDRALPELLEAVAAHLRGGGSLAQAVTAVAPSPGSRSELARHWHLVVSLVPTSGVDAALSRWAAAPDAGASVALAAGALRLAAMTGGSPARAVDGVASTLRSRLAVAEELRALTSQARASAVVIALAPVFFGSVAGMTDRRIVEFFTTPGGAVVLAVGLGLDAVGGWWMTRLCRLRP